MWSGKITLLLTIKRQRGISFLSWVSMWSGKITLLFNENEDVEEPDNPMELWLEQLANFREKMLSYSTLYNINH